MKENTKKLYFHKWLPVMILLIIFMFGGIVGCGKKEEDYRQIQVYKIDGTAMIERQGSSMEAYENMQLQSGDLVETDDESSIQLKLDEDKYILVEPDSKISLQATGNSVDSKTSIYLEKGAIVNQLDNSLSDDSSYQVTTPNSTMAVRGTTFRVEITFDENGESYTNVAVYGGKVECNLVFPDGTIAQPVMVEQGTEVLIWGDDVESEYVGSGNTNYEELKELVLDFLGAIIERGEELSISREEVEVLKEAAAALEEADDREDLKEEDTMSDKELEEDSEEAEEDKDNESDSEDADAEKEQNKDHDSKVEDKTSDDTKEEDTTKQEALNNGVTEETSKPTDSDSSSGSGMDGTGGGTSSGSGSGGTGGGTSSGSGSGGTGGGTSSGSGSGGTGGNATREITIQFCVSNETNELIPFATKKQSVAADATEISSADITRPLLQPGESGSWSFGDIKDIYAESTNSNLKIPDDNVVTIIWSN